ncbi:AMP-binding protein [uncultured Erythrobacter sp.]|uniref:AMP-binding protein n=1 Tax=uncultured Erythrobacter sp. TaxID=263913 RepID=UPI0026267846|nr:AMP-binding protein [uncultured Erythrobacter sp.]
MHYDDAYQNSIDDPDGFWLDAAKALDWDNAPSEGLGADRSSWFAGGQLNLCHNAIDRHVDAGRGRDPALIYESPVTGISRTYSFSELQSEVAQAAGMLAAQGAKLGDRVIIYMPMIPQAVFAMLACARLGLVHSVVFGGFSAAELAKRIDDCAPKLVLTASCGIEGAKVIPYKPIVDDALARATKEVSALLVWQREQCSADLTSAKEKFWQDELANAEPADCVSVSADHPLYILYTSGTTGKPKGVVRETGGYGVALAWSMPNIYGARPEETYWAASDIGWVVGHSYIVYGPLLNGNATVLFEGKPVGTPDAGIFWQIVAKHQVSILFTAPTAIRAIRGADPAGDLLRNAGPDSLRALFLAGERADPDTVKWVGEQLGKPVIDHWWQTELGWPALATCIGLGSDPAPIGAAGYPVPGFAFRVLDENGSEIDPEVTGNLAIKEPLPPGSFRSLWQDEEGFRGYFTAFEGFYATGDAGVMGEDGAFRVMGRTDDIINVAGHRLSTGQIEEVVAACPCVVECAVIGGADDLKGEVPVVFYVSSGGDENDGVGEVIGAVRREISPIAAPRHVIAVKALPKTRSGKILRNLLRAIVNGWEITIPQTIENPEVVQATIDHYEAVVA